MPKPLSREMQERIRMQYEAQGPDNFFTRMDPAFPNLGYDPSDAEQQEAMRNHLMQLQERDRVRMAAREQKQNGEVFDQRSAAQPMRNPNRTYAPPRPSPQPDGTGYGNVDNYRKAYPIPEGPAVRQQYQSITPEAEIQSDPRTRRRPIMDRLDPYFS